jgi:SPP1 gp7 family putative phage head morphogenesis protein
MAALTPSVPGTFEEALAWAKARNVVLPEEFYGALQDTAKGRAFTVSGLQGLDQIQRTLDSLTGALESGETFDSWKKRIGPDLALPDPNMETVFRNFMQNAYNSGRWEQFDSNKENRPYLMFSAINDSRTTDICRHRNGMIRPVDDPFWSRSSPPCHHRCRSVLLSLSESQARARSPGNAGLNKPTPSDKPADGWGYKPTGDDVAAGLVTALADKAQNLPSSWLAALLQFFVGGWGAIASWIKRMFT